MRWLLFLSRAAFIAGILMAMALIYLLVPFTLTEAVQNNILTAGYGFALVILPLINMIYLCLYVANRPLLRTVPGWLRMANISFLLLWIVFSCLMSYMETALP